MKVMIASLSLAVLLSLAGCSTGEATVDDLVGARWTGPGGDPVSSRVINVIRGPEHCDWQSSLWMHVGWPLGTRADSAADIRQYVRDPEDVLPVETETAFDTDVEMPKGASPTGFQADGVELWFGEDDGDHAVYLVFADHVERWPRAAEVIACA